MVKLKYIKMPFPLQLEGHHQHLIQLLQYNSQLLSLIFRLPNHPFKMKVFAILALATSVLAAATPMVERDTFDPNTALDKYRQTAVETTQELFLNGCHIVG